MATPSAGYAGKVQVATDSSGAPGTYKDIGGDCKGTGALKVDMLDVTTFGAGYHKRLPGLTDADISTDFYLDQTDDGQQILLSAVQARNRVWLKVYTDATHNIQLACYVTDFPFDIDPAQAVKVQCKFAFDGTPANPVVIA